MSRPGPDPPGAASTRRAGDACLAPASDAGGRGRRLVSGIRRGLDVEEPPRGRGDLGHRRVERLGVPLRRHAVAAHLADELEGGGADLLGGGRLFGSAKGLDGSAHAGRVPPVAARPPVGRARAGRACPVDTIGRRASRLRRGARALRGDDRSGASRRRPSILGRQPLGRGPVLAPTVRPTRTPSASPDRPRSASRLTDGGVAAAASWATIGSDSDDADDASSIRRRCGPMSSIVDRLARPRRVTAGRTRAPRHRRTTASRSLCPVDAAEVGRRTRTRRPAWPSSGRAVGLDGRSSRRPFAL